MNNIVCKVAALGGTISTTDISHLSEYKRLLRAKERGDLIKLRHGIYAVPDALLNTMIDVERIVPNGIVCLYNAWAYHQLSTTVPPAFCIAIANKRKVVIPDTLPIELYYWKKENLEFGIMDAEISGYHVRITDMERLNRQIAEQDVAAGRELRFLPGEDGPTVQDVFDREHKRTKKEQGNAMLNDGECG